MSEQIHPNSVGNSVPIRASNQLMYFEIYRGGTVFMDKIEKDNESRLLAGRMPLTILGQLSTNNVFMGFADVDELWKLVKSTRSERIVDVRLFIENINESCFRKIVHAGLTEQDLREFLIRAEDIRVGQLFFYERIGGRIYLLKRVPKKDQLQPQSMPYSLTEDRTISYGIVGQDFSLEEVDFSKYAF